MRFDVDKMLDEAYCREYTADGSAQRVLGSAGQRATGRKKHPVLVPVMACVLAAIVLVTAVPPVRAAVQGWFSSIAEYMATPTGERAELKGANVQQDVSRGAATTEIAPNANTADAAWVGNLSVTVTEAMFDGDKLYINYTIDTGGEDLLVSYTPEYFQAVYNMPQGGEGTLKVMPQAVLRTSEGTLYGNAYHVEKSGSAYYLNAIFGDDITNLYPATDLPNMDDLVFDVFFSEQTVERNDSDQIDVDSNYKLLDTDAFMEDTTWEPSVSYSFGGYTGDGEGFTAMDDPRGRISVPISVDTNNDMAETVTDERIRINGIGSTVKYVRVKPFEIAIQIMMANNYADEPDDYSFDVYADGVQLQDNKGNLGALSTIPHYNQDEVDSVGVRPPNSYEVFSYPYLHAYYHEVIIPFPEQAIGEITLVPFDKDTEKRFEDDKVTLPVNFTP